MTIIEKSWDPITRVVGSLGIHARVDMGARRVLRCHSTSSIFRGYSIFLKGKRLYIGWCKGTRVYNYSSNVRRL